MTRSKRIIIPFTLLIFITLACAVPGLPAPNNDAANTAAAETGIAGLTQNAPTATLTLTNAPTATMTFTPTLIRPTRLATDTFTPGPLPTGTQPTITAVLSAEPLATVTLTPVEITVSRPTNCRSGPGKAYDVVGTLLPDVKTTVHGRDSTNQYWYIRNPDIVPEYCWVWGEYATFTGQNLSVSVLALPPTPTATASAIPFLSYKVKGAGMASCSGAFWMNIQITNYSTDVFKSIKIEMQDTTNLVNRNLAVNGFANSTGCDNLEFEETIPPQGIVVVSSARFDYSLRGSKLKAYITICTDIDLKGVCTTIKASFSP
ncbi:MAG: SH3 domain-containing protein [Anaerolineales bacterium]|nr:SH3 domain-containing protein [Anaerolineales bacterium]